MPISAIDQAWLQARETTEAALCFIEINHPMMETFRFVRNTEDQVIRGNTYTACPFELDIVSDTDQPARATLTFPNVDRQIGITLATLVGPPEITIEVASSARLDDAPIVRAARLKLRNVNVDPLVLTGDLSRVDDGTETCGTIRVTPARCPALFRRR